LKERIETKYIGPMDNSEIEKTAEEVYGLCTKYCDFLDDKSIWIVDLSNGITVYQDDDRSGKEKVAWKRLRKYCDSENVDIINMRLKFRSHTVPIDSGDDIDGYYFAYGAHKEFDEEITRQHYVCGFCQQGIINCCWYSTPELIVTRESKRKIKPDDTEDGRLILKQTLIA